MGCIHPKSVVDLVASRRELDEYGNAVTRNRIENFYTVGAVIGKGMYGNVHEGVHIGTGQKVAIKKIDRRKSRPSYVDNEVYVLRLAADNPYIVQLLDVFETPEWVYLVLELMEGGELFDYVVANGAYSEVQAQAPLLGMMRALHFMHSHGVLHRDLKPENILLAKTGANSPVKLCDFGLSRVLGQGETVRGVCGTWAYSAPEMLSEGRPGYAFPADMWSMGVIMYVLMGGYHPFDPDGEGTQETVAAAMASGKFEFDDDVWKPVSRAAKDLIRRLLVVDPEQRCSAEEALKHPWMRSAAHQVGDPNPTAGGAAETVQEYKAGMRRKLKASFLVAYASASMASAVSGADGAGSRPSSVASRASRAKGSIVHVRSRPGSMASKDEMLGSLDYVHVAHTDSGPVGASVDTIDGAGGDVGTSGGAAGFDDVDDTRSVRSARSTASRASHAQSVRVSGSAKRLVQAPQPTRKEIGGLLDADNDDRMKTTDMHYSASFYPAPRAGKVSDRKTRNKTRRRRPRGRGRSHRRRRRRDDYYDDGEYHDDEGDDYRERRRSRSAMPRSRSHNSMHDDDDDFASPRSARVDGERNPGGERGGGRHRSRSRSRGRSRRRHHHSHGSDLDSGSDFSGSDSSSSDGSLYSRASGRSRHSSRSAHTEVRRGYSAYGRSQSSYGHSSAPTSAGNSRRGSFSRLLDDVEAGRDVSELVRADKAAASAGKPPSGRPQHRRTGSRASSRGSRAEREADHVGDEGDDHDSVAMRAAAAGAGAVVQSGKISVGIAGGPRASGAPTRIRERRRSIEKYHAPGAVMTGSTLLSGIDDETLDTLGERWNKLHTPTPGAEERKFDFEGKPPHAGRLLDDPTGVTSPARGAAAAALREAAAAREAAVAKTTVVGAAATGPAIARATAAPASGADAAGEVPLAEPPRPMGLAGMPGRTINSG